MSKRLGDLAIPAGSYVDKHGQTKMRWERVGALWEGDCGKMFVTLRRTFAPSGIPVDDGGTNKESIVISVFSDKPQRSY